MRLVRFPGRPAKVSDDIRAALSSLGDGADVAGGIALVGVRPPGMEQDVDAVLVLPRGIAIVVGVDLPDPAVRLQAPIADTWKVDGWPLVRADDVVNPAVEALALSGRVADLARAAEPGIAVGTVIAVGPYAETVEQPPSELTGPVRVVHPTSAAMLSSLVSLATGKHDLTVDRARALLDQLAPTPCELDDAALIGEGFAATTSGGAATGLPHDTAATTPAIPVVTVTGPHTTATPAQPSASLPTRPRPRRRGRRGVLTAAAVFAVAIIVTVSIIALSGGEPAGVARSAASPVVTAAGVEFTEYARGDDAECARHALGELQVFLDTSSCSRVWRGSYQARVAGRAVAVSVAALTFSDEPEATAFHTLADTPGSGVLIDLAAERTGWPGEPPSFANAAYASQRQGRTVLLVLACSRTGESTPDDPALVTAAEVALQLPGSS
ncbi:hypothetical protein SacmaDRAFT_1413 [Saccharomonospora marina XMU15]|uniref:Uncharacterized protein n=1 Tax=Saccharomonospora marina XMU15 TaxID=882083 RepID=H5X0G6_9PSEU|nr:hypothetical protein [Saccharomonospora marina]EHR49691.1 hypothetical protein SacmaDRAFT_1413 [Saccharomonospora marina XMU15]